LRNNLRGLIREKDDILKMKIEKQMDKSMKIAEKYQNKPQEKENKKRKQRASSISERRLSSEPSKPLSNIS
jgi:hypothetical protein